MRIDTTQGDCMEVIDKLPKNSVDLVITSPPYNLGKAYEKKRGIEEYLAWYYDFVEILKSTIKDTGSVCWQTGNYVEKSEVYPLDIHFYPIFKNAGFKLRNRIIWHFGHGLHCKRRFSGRYETILWFTKSDEYKFNLDNVRVPAKYPGKKHFRGAKKGQLSGNPKGTNPSDFWRYVQNDFDQELIDIPNVKANHPEKTGHPCQFPIELVERCVLAFTDENDTVLDPFAGVGSAGIAALRHNRHSILIEKDKDYYRMGLEQIEAWKTGKLKVRKIGTEIHTPKKTDKLALFPEEWKEHDHSG